MRPLVLLALLVLLVPFRPAAADDPKIAIVLKNHQWVPNEVPAPAGTKLELLIKNEQTEAGEFESDTLHREKVVPPGGQISVFVGPLEPGRYEFYDDYHSSTRGFLVVK
jgi:hypothetical protein